MFESDFTTIMWDAHKASDGTYFWIIEYTDVNKNSGTKEGGLMILRQII